MKPQITAGTAAAIKRVAIHEAGHVVTAWFSRTGLQVNFTAITASVRTGRIGVGGLTLIPWTSAVSRLEPKISWDYLVALMGGIAAELLYLNDADPSDSPKSDMVRSCDLAGLIAQKVTIKELRRQHGRFGRRRLRQLIDREKLEKDAHGLVELALKDASELLNSRRKPYLAVRRALQQQGCLNQAELTELLGPPRPDRREH